MISKVYEQHTITAGSLYTLNCDRDRACHFKITGNAGGTVSIRALAQDTFAGAVLANAVACATYLQFVLSTDGNNGAPQVGTPAAGAWSTALFLPDILEITPAGATIVLSVVHIIEE